MKRSWMRPFSVDRYAHALQFAARAHGAQRTPHDLPYVVHVVTVAAEVGAALRLEPGRDEDLAISAALLHDVVEDTVTTLAEVEAAFGVAVARGVGALTKDAALEKALRMPDSLDRILREGPEVAMVKLADRITNLGPPPPSWGPAKIEAYRAEAGTILERLGHASAVLSERLEDRIARYPRG